MDGLTLVLFIVFGALTIWAIFDFFVTHRYFDGPSAVKKALLAPFYYFFGYKCECGEQFLFREEYEKHIKNCSTHAKYKDFHGWWPF